MSYKCIVCDKKTMTGNNVSHSKRRTKRTFKPNLQKIKILINGISQKEYVCTSCLKAGKVTKG